MRDHASIGSLFSKSVISKWPVQEQPAMAAGGQHSGDSEVLVTKTNPQAIQPYLGQLFILLHYLHEELLLSQFHDQQAANLARLLCKWIMSLPNREAQAKVAYVWYYVNVHKISDLDEEVNEFFGPQLQDLRSSPPAVSIQQVPVLRHTLSMIADNKQTQQLFLVLFETTKKVVRAVQTLAMSK